MSRLLLMGAGGHASEVFEWARLYASRSVDGFYAENGVACETVLAIHHESNIPIFSDLSDVGVDYSFLTAVGDSYLRYKFYQLAVKKGLKPAQPFICSNAIVCPQCVIGDDSTVCPNVIITTRNIKIGHSSVLNFGSTIGHDCSIGDYFTALPYANVAGNVTLGEYVTLGANSCIKEKLNITDHVFIGMGSVVVKDILESGVYVGNPARKIGDIKK